MTILQFSTDLPRKRRKAPAEDGPLGQILLFTGVRIERHAEIDLTVRPEPGSASAGRRRRKA